MSLSKIKKVLKKNFPNVDFVIEKEPILNVLEISYCNTNNVLPSTIQTEISKVSKIKTIVTKSFNTRL